MTIYFKGQRPFVTPSFNRYEIHEFVGELDVKLEINGKHYYPKLICKLFIDLEPNASRLARHDYALQRARDYSPMLK